MTSAGLTTTRSSGRALDWLFRIIVVVKGIDGVLEILAGLALLVIPHSAIAALAHTVTRGELTEDPGDVVANYIVNSADAFAATGSAFAAIYLLIHGVSKVVLVWALLRERLWAYPWMIGFLVAFIGYQGYLLVTAPSASLALLTVFDAFVVWLTVLEYRRHRRVRARR